ncbi:hypothetical protein A5893_08920 [Pedobacter psychrophilus]|uniref:Uncharacterized protein n=1 Tax=Pedobacter psychrophilus TaxID=1826909 RepID=A0A179DF61_9SPHI|nr:hypothetical protein [Pedobacter psychrophilus]OAQ39695.1 hypothetical protein A5893_08920 [Pedobacter psychrophilus]
MIKKVSCILLILLISLSSFTRLFYFAGYELNKDYIAKNLCINKDKPEMQCNGKCFLTRKIAEAEKQQQSQERKTQKDLTQQIMLITTFHIKFFNLNSVTENSVYQNNYSYIKSSSFYHPPPTFDS